VGRSEGGGGGEMNNIEDPLENFSEDYQEEIISEKDDAHTTIKKYLTDDIP
jgi:hypothetical protein